MDSMMSSISNTYNLASSSAKNSTAASSLDKDYSNASDEELYDACKQFESYFIEQVLDKFQEALTSEEDSSSASMGQLKDYATDGLMEQYASMISDSGSLGLADKLYEQMKRNYDV